MEPLDTAPAKHQIISGGGKKKPPPPSTQTHRAGTVASGMMEFPISEIKRVPLEEPILKILLLGLGNPEEFLKSCMEPPSNSQIMTAIKILVDIGAIVQDSRSILQLTPLGYHLALMPLDVRLGKMLLYGCIFSCIEPILTIVAFLSGRSPFVQPPDADENEVYSVHTQFSYSDESHVAGDATGKEKRAGLSSPDSLFFSDHLAVVTGF